MTALKSKLESVLLTAGEPIAVQKLAKVIGEKPSVVHAALEELRAEYGGRGIRLVSTDELWQFGTAPENSGTVEKFVKSEFGEELSRAAIETIAIIAYKGPITRAEIEYIRGVNSSFTLHNLLLRGLVDHIENPRDARSYLYSINAEFLKYLGLLRREDLPQWDTWNQYEMPKTEGELKENAANDKLTNVDLS